MSFRGRVSLPECWVWSQHPCFFFKCLLLFGKKKSFWDWITGSAWVPCAAGNRDLCDLPRWHLLNDISEHVSLEETEMSPLDVHDRCMHGNWFGWKRFQGSNCKHLKGFHMTNLVAGKFSKYEMLLLNLVSNLQEMSQVHHLRMFPCFAVLGASPPPLTCKPHADPLHLLWKTDFFSPEFSHCNYG